MDFGLAWIKKQLRRTEAQPMIKFSTQQAQHHEKVFDTMLPSTGTRMLSKTHTWWKMPPNFFAAGASYGTRVLRPLETGRTGTVSNAAVTR